MKIGVAKESKPAERRVALAPAGAHELVADGHRVLVETGAGEGSGYADKAYADAGAVIVGDTEAWAESELLLKVKEPVIEEYGLLRDDLILFTYLHLAPNRDLIDALLDAGTCAIAYETVQDSAGRLPLLAPMSEIAGRLSVQAGAYFLQGPQGGRGILIGGAPGVAPARVLVLGGGTAGAQAAQVAAGMGADVTVLEHSLPRIRELEQLFFGRVRVLMSDAATTQKELEQADLLIGAVLVNGARAPRLIDRQALATIGSGSVIVDIAIDQGGCVETSRPTTHDDPTYAVDDVVHYCVANMPGAVPSTSTRALTNATLPYIRTLATLGVDDAIASDPGLALGINVRGGEIVYAPVASAYRKTPPRTKIDRPACGGGRFPMNINTPAVSSPLEPRGTSLTDSDAGNVVRQFSSAYLPNTK